MHERLFHRFKVKSKRNISKNGAEVSLLCAIFLFFCLSINAFVLFLCFVLLVQDENGKKERQEQTCCNRFDGYVT